MKIITPLLKKTPLALALSALIVASVQAQDTAEQPEKKAKRGAAAMMMEEIQVTARKRSNAEALQDVPLAVTAYSGEQLDSMFVQNLQDLSFTAPNVQLESAGTFPGVQNFSIRGQGINSSIPSIDPTVGTFVDGVYLGVTFGAVIDMFEVESVEVLRGPQGLLFGRNVTGGAVALRTSRPDGEFGYRVRSMITDENRTNVAASIEGSLIEDKLAAKLVMYYDDDEGYFENNNVQADTTNDNFGALQTDFARATLVFNPTDYLDLTLIVEDGKTTGQAAAWGSVDAQRDGIIGGFHTDASTNVFGTASDDPGFTDMTWTQVTQETNFDVNWGDGKITNILAWREVALDSQTDLDASEQLLFQVAGTTTQDQLSNELRYAGSFMDDKLDLTTGVYYFEQDISYREGRTIFGGAILVAAGGNMDHDTWGAFTTADYHLTDALTLTGGIRYTKENKSASVIDNSAAAGGTCTDIVSYQCAYDDLADSWSNVTPKLGASYQLNEDSQVYAFYTKGFRSGGVNFRNSKPDLIPAGPTKEEEQDSFEIGLKSDWMDGRLRTNVAAFYNKISDMQRELNMSDPDVLVLQGTVNAGDATIQGVEAEVIALITDNLAINMSAGYLDGEWDKVNPDYQEFIGSDLTRLSPKTASIGLTYDMDLADFGSMTLRSSYSYRDAAAYLDSNFEYFDVMQDVNASIDYLSPDQNWRVSLFGKNLNDQARYGNLTQASVLGTVGPMQKGKRLGLEVEYTY